MDKQTIEAEIRKEGFDPILIQDPPGHVYPPHRHPETKLLAFLLGEMKVKVGENTFTCHAGDKVVIPGNVEHSAQVGPEGCVFFWSEKL
ncbi:MAG TPA: cupin domain-containing protein [Candidatus Acidoferrales bacterium]|nr:cupin domain-containing protein [Candidatus Acidoferrales bacterium]